MPTTMVSTPDGRFIDIDHPEDADENSILQYASMQFAEDPSLAYGGQEGVDTDTDLMGRAGEFAKGIPRGFLSSFATSAEGIAQLADTATDFVGLDNLIDSGDDNEIVRLARMGQEKIDETMGADPAYRDMWTTKFGDALGSLASFFTPAAGAKLVGLTGKVAKHLPAAGFATGVGSGEQSQRIQMARDQGIEVSEGEEDAAIAFGSVIGLTELAPVGFILKGLKRADMEKPFFKSLMPRLKGALASGSVEAVQEVTAGIMQDLTEKNLYNPDLPMFESAWDELSLGGAAGFTADLVLNAVVGRRARGITAQQKEREKGLREKESTRLDQLAKEFPDIPRQEIAGLLPYIPETPTDSGPAGTARAMAGTIETNLGENFPLNTTFTSMENNTPSTVVRDSNGEQHGPEFATAEEAHMFAGAMNEVVFERSLDLQANLAINQSAAEYTSRDKLVLRMLGRRLLHPDENTFTTEELNNAAGTTLENDYNHESMGAQEAIDAGIKPKDMTAAQQINARRLKSGRPEARTFSVTEAKSILKEDAGKLATQQGRETEEIEALLRLKNVMSGINSPEVRAIAEVATGVKARGRTAIADMSAAEKALLYDKLQTLPKFSKPTQLPTFGLRPYKPAHYQAASKIALERTSDPQIDLGESATPSREAIEKRSEPLTEAAYKRLVSDMSQDGRLGQQMTQAQDDLRTRTAQEEKTKARQQVEMEGVAKAIKSSLKGYGLERIGSTMMDFIRQAKRTDGKIVLGEVTHDSETEGGYRPSLNNIFIAIEAVKHNPEYVASKGKSKEERQATLERLAVETLNHEIIHAMRQADLFTQQEWEMLEKLARKHGPPGGDMSYTQWAMVAYEKLSPVAQMEEAIAEMVRDGLSGKLRIGGKPKSLFKRIAQFLKSMVGIKETGGYETFDDLVAAVTTGKVAARPEEQRTLRETERKDRIVPDRGVLPQAMGAAPVKRPTKAQQGESNTDFLESKRMDNAKVMGFVHDVFHGTTHEIKSFDQSKAETGADWGAAIYSTTSWDDARDNYASLSGPDLKIKIDMLAEKIQSQSEYEGYDYQGDLMKDLPYEAARQLAEEELFGGQNVVMELKARMDNPFRFGGENPTFMESEQEQEDPADFMDEARATTSHDRSDFDDDLFGKEEYEEAVKEEAEELAREASWDNESTGPLVDFINSLNYSGYDVDNVIEALADYQMEGISAENLDKIMRETEWYAEDEYGNLVNSEVYRQALEDAGFDGVIDANVYNKFGAGNARFMQPMAGIEPDTEHYIMFRPNQARLKNAEFNPDRALSDDLSARRVFHGSPYKFQQFKVNHIGSGADAQMQGHGLYFADNRDFAETYSTTSSEVYLEGNPLKEEPWFDGLHEDDQFWIEEIMRGYAQGITSRERIARNAQKGLKPWVLVDNQMRKGKDVSISPGHVYLVDIDDSVIDKMLLWDKPIDEQPEVVQKAYYEHVRPMIIRSTGDVGAANLSARSGRAIYETLADPSVMGTQKAVSDFLQSLGVPGTAYSAGIRKSGKGGFVGPLVDAVKGRQQEDFNFVVFDETAITLLERDGKPVPDDLQASKRFTTKIADTMLSQEQRKMTILDRVDPITGTFKETATPNKTLLASAAQKFFEERGGAVLDLSDPQTIKIVAKMIAAESEVALVRNADAIGWYDKHLKTAKRLIGLLHPELSAANPEYDATAEHAFDYATAITSNGLKVIENYKRANEQYEYWKQHGRFMQIGFGKQGDSMVAGFKFYNKMRDHGQTDEKIIQFLNTESTPSQLRQNPVIQELEAQELISSDELAEAGVYGSYVLGPKIGQGFYQNLRGNYQTLTMDRWWMRMFNRHTGNPYMAVQDATLVENAKKIRKLLKPALKRGNKYTKQTIETAMEETGYDGDTDQSILKLAVQMDRIFQRDYARAARNKTKRPAKVPLFYATQRGRENYERKLQDTPRGGTDRQMMRNATMQAVELVKKQLGVDLTPADMQALMWYSEKELFRSAGARVGPGYDYADGAISVLKDEGINDDRIQAALPTTDRVRVDFKRDERRADGSVRTESGRDNRAAGRAETDLAQSRRVTQREHDPANVAKVVAENKSAAMAPGQAEPYYSHFASPDAQYVAQNPEAGRTSDDLMQSIRVAPLSAEDEALLDRSTGSPPQGHHPLKSYEKAAGSTATPSRMRYIMTKAKQETINRYARLEYLNWTTELRENLADTSSIAAVMHADRAMGIVAAAIRHGVPVYANGTMMVVNKNTIKELERKNPEAAAKLEAELNQQGIDLNEVKSLIEVMSPLYSKEYGNLTRWAQSYAISKRSHRLDNANVKVPMTRADRIDIEQKIKRFVDPETGENIIERWHRDWQKYNDAVINMMGRSGILTDETAKMWREMADYYPFYRVAEGGGQTFHEGQRVFGGMTAAISMQKLKGGESPINMDMIEAISMNMSAAVQMSMKNIAQQRIVRDMVQLGLAEEINPGEPTTSPHVDFKVAGKKRRFLIFDPLVHQSMLPLDGTSMVATIRNTFGMPATALRELVTRDPGFMAVNLLRDSLSSYATSGASLLPLISTAKGLFDGVERLEKLGVVGGYDYANDPDNIVKFWNKTLKRSGIAVDGSATATNLFVRAWDALGRGTTASDAATRNAVFDDVYAKTGNIAEASFQAMEVINFGRKGRSPIVRAISSMVPFLNARFQGLDVFYRAYTGHYTANKIKNRRQVVMSALTRGALLTSMTALYWTLVSDDDQYKDASDFVKDNNWLIPTPWGVPITLPIPFEVGLLFKVFPETVLDATLGEKSGKEVRETLVRSVGTTLEISPFSVQFAGPIMEAVANYNSFTGRQVVPQYLMENKTAGLQSKQYTTEFAKALGKQFNISPMKIDHVFTGYLGTMGAYVYDMIDVGLKSEYLKGDNTAIMPARHYYDYPIIKRAFGREFPKGMQQDAYDLYRASNEAYLTLRSLMKDGRMDEAEAYIKNRELLISMRGPLNNLKDIMGRLRQQKEQIARSDMPADMKQRETDLLDEQLNAMLRDVVPYIKESADLPFLDKVFY